MSATNEIPVLTISASATSSAALPKNYSATSLESPASPSTGRLCTWFSPPPLSLAIPHSLRKSVSVDSFAKLTHDSSPSGRGYTVSNQNASQNLVYLSTRHRQDPLTSESDIDRYDPLSMEHLSLKNQEMQKPLVRGGELPLPSRTHPSVVHPSSKRGNSYTTLNSSRSRSGSLGICAGNPLTRTVTNSSLASFPPGRPMVIAVVGTSNSGKSTVIRKGLSGFGLTDPTQVSGPTCASNLPRYMRHACQFSLENTQSSSNASLQVLEVIEVEIETTDGLPDWPQCLPPIDGVIICYDSSSKSSYQPVESLLKNYSSQTLPVMVLGCKADLERAIEPFDASVMLKQHDAGLIEVSAVVEGGREKMKQSFAYMLKAIMRQRVFLGPSRIDNQNPASPELPYKEPPWEKTRANTPTATPTASPPSPSSIIADTTGLTSPPTAPASPVITQSSGDSISKLDALEPLSKSSLVLPVEFETPQQRVSSLDTVRMAEHETTVEQPPEERKNGFNKNESRRRQWVFLADLLDKLIFLVISGDDPNFITHFLLTYRRFATPRSVLLAMQKRMRQFDDPCGDPLFASFAQMSICQLLTTWIHEYPNDFAVRGTLGALNALIKSIISKTHLLHYGSRFLPFLEQLPSLNDQDAAWALKVDISDTDSDDYTLEDGDDDEATVAEAETVESAHNRTRTDSSPLEINFLSRERVHLSHQVGYTFVSSNDLSPKQHIKELVKVAQDVLITDSTEIAEELTRKAVKQFLFIKPRDWLHFTLVSGKKDGEPISSFNEMSNHIADWVVSLILCHERPKHRARQIEKFVDIAVKLRQMNNYSGLRAFVAGINNATDDPTMEAFKSRSPDHLKHLQSWDVLLQQTRAHRSYRMALRNSKGACIPAFEVHMSDLIKAHEGNEDNSDSDPQKIHWGKYNMMGGFVSTTLQCQSQCRNSTDYNFPERPVIAELLVRRPVMSIEMQRSRLKTDENEFDEYYSSAPGSGPSGQPGLRKLFFR